MDIAHLLPHKGEQLLEEVLRRAIDEDREQWKEIARKRKELLSWQNDIPNTILYSVVSSLRKNNYYDHNADYERIFTSVISEKPKPWQSSLFAALQEAQSTAVIFV